MEAFVNDTTFDLSGTSCIVPDYNPSTNSFVSPSKTSSSYSEGVPVRQVTEKKLPARNVNGRAVEGRFDLFTGLLDAITGEPLHGIRHYSITGELYEGKFRNNGIRHGSGAIVKNISLPPPRKAIPELLGDFLGAESPHSNLLFQRANFFGSYWNDEPTFGTLVTDSYTYRGHFRDGRFHGVDGELIHSDGFRYKGEFHEGLFHGVGREWDPESGEYHGEYKNGMKHGMGTFKEASPHYGNGFDDHLENVNDSRNEPSLTIEIDITSKQDRNVEKEIASTSDDDWLSNDDQLSKLESNDSASQIGELSDRYIYSGLFNCNLRQGEGTEWTATGECFSGQFLANRRHGHGTLKILTTGIVFEGKWRAGEPVEGNGWRILYPSGDIYCGHTCDYQPHGYGIHQHVSGDVYAGDWIHGRRHGNGIHADPNGTEFSGEWKNNENVSKKRLEATDGTLSEIAETLRINDEDNDKQHAGDVTEEEQGTGEVSKHDKQLAFLKKAMAKSIETSLQIITSQSETNSEEFESFTDAIPQTRMRAAKKSSERKSKPKGEAKAELHTYANGDTYLGALDPLTFQRTGYGVYVSKATGCSYTGMFKENKRHGFGILIHAQFGKFAGEFYEDKKHGEGTLILSDSSSYHGGFCDGAFDGKGTLCERDGKVYVGEWKAGLRHGEGMETMKDGKVYKGSFNGGKREGTGTLLEKSAGKTIYRGKWKDGKYQGEGILIERRHVANSNRVIVIRFEGEFSVGMKHGYGVLSNESENTEWKGIWSHDKPVSGKWRVRYSDGGLFVGHGQVLEENASIGDRVVVIPEGFGTFQYQNGDVYVGTFEYGIRHGFGTCKFATGEQWEGAWIDDRMEKCGSGVLTLADGTKHVFKGNASRKGVSLFSPAGSREIDAVD
jgi:hypothetical protein